MKLLTAKTLIVIFVIANLLSPTVAFADPIPQDNPLGTITPPDTVPTIAGDPTGYVASLIRNSISLLLIVAFVAFFIWTIIAGFRFIFAGSDEKAVGSAWSQIYWGMIGMTIVLGSFAIIKLVETFFNVTIFTNFQLPGS